MGVFPTQSERLSIIDQATQTVTPQKLSYESYAAPPRFVRKSGGAENGSYESYETGSSEGRDRCHAKGAARRGQAVLRVCGESGRMWFGTVISDALPRPVIDARARNRGPQARRAKDDAPPCGGFLASAEHRLRFSGSGGDKAQPPIWGNRPRARRLWRGLLR